MRPEIGSGRRETITNICRKKMVRVFLVAFSLLTISTSTTVFAKTTIYTNGSIITMGTHNSVVEAMVVRQGKILGVGNSDALSRRYGRGASVVDLEGKTIVPGFIDAHSHFPASGAFIQGHLADLNSLPIGDVQNIEQILEKLRAQAERKKPGQWLLGMGYDDTLLPENRHPTKEELDQVSTEHPIWIYHISGHLGVANSLGLAMAGIDKDTPNPGGGVIDHDPVTGELTGLLEENAKVFMDGVVQKTDIWTAYQIAIAASKQYLAAGVTTAQSGHHDTLKTMAMMLMGNLNLLPLRLVVWTNSDVGDKRAEGRFNNFFTRIFRKSWVSLGAVKLVADGSIQGFTGHLTEPYASDFHGDSEWRGYPTLPRDELVEQVSKYHKAGLQVAIHGNGDAAIDDIIYAYRIAQKNHYREDARPLIVHSQMAREDQLDAMAELNMMPTFFGLHTYYWGDRHRDTFIGPERAERISPARSAQERGIRFSLHSDTPIVPMNPLLMVWNAVNRITSSGKVLGEKQTISVMAALRAVTIDAAWQVFEAKSRGSLEKGKLADFVVLSENPLENPKTIDRIQVMETYIGGVRRF